MLGRAGCLSKNSRLFVCMLSNDVLGSPAKDGPPCGGIGRETGHWAQALVQDLGQL